jgi:hypothetical protein
MRSIVGAAYGYRPQRGHDGRDRFAVSSSLVLSKEAALVIRTNKGFCNPVVAARLLLSTVGEPSSSILAAHHVGALAAPEEADREW